MSLQSRRCRNCRKKADGPGAFVSPIVAFCSYECLSAWNQTKAAKKQRLVAERKVIRDQKDRLKKLSQWRKEAQASFNRYVRVRDSNKPCISCGIELGKDSLGGTADASHYRARGSAPQHRFNLLNVWSSCKRCNRYLSGNLGPYRVELINMIGMDRVEALENDNATKRHINDVEYLRRIKRIFNKRARLYEKLFR